MKTGKSNHGSNDTWLCVLFSTALAGLTGCGPDVTTQSRELTITAADLRQLAPGESYYADLTDLQTVYVFDGTQEPLDVNRIVLVLPGHHEMRLAAWLDQVGSKMGQRLPGGYGRLRIAAASTSNTAPQSATVTGETGKRQSALMACVSDGKSVWCCHFTSKGGYCEFSVPPSRMCDDDEEECNDWNL